jgi:hypothetical protein
MQIKKWTKDEIQEGLTSLNLVQTSFKYKRSLNSYYTMRHFYKKFLADKTKKISAPMLEFFKEIGKIKLSTPKRWEKEEYMGKEIIQDKKEKINNNISDTIFEELFSEFKNEFLKAIAISMKDEIEKIRKFQYEKGYTAGLEDGKKSNPSVKIKDFLSNFLKEQKGDVV